MGQIRASSKKRTKDSMPSSKSKELAGYPVDMTEERPGLDQLSGASLPINESAKKVASQQSLAPNTACTESAPALKPGPVGAATASAPHTDSTMFTEQLQRLRARLHSVVQGVREVAQSLDEPHSLIANVRDQLQSRHESTRRNSLSCTAQPGAYDSESRRNSLASAPAGYTINPSLSRNSSGGVGAFPGGVPALEGFVVPTATAEVSVCGAAGASPEGDDPPGSGLSVKARVAAVELRSRSGGGAGHSEPLPLLQSQGLPVVAPVERKASMRVGGGARSEEGAMFVEEEGDPATPPRIAHPANSGTDSCSAHATSSSWPDSAATVASAGGKDGAGVAVQQLAHRFEGVATSATSAASNATETISPWAPTADDIRSSLFSSSSRGGGSGGGASAGSLPYNCGGIRAASEAAAATAAADLVAANAEELLGPGDACLLAATANAAAAEAYLRDHPEMVRELWTLRARVRRQEGELATMVKQLSTKNAQLDQAQTTVVQKEKELSSLTQRLTGVLVKLQTFQAAHQHHQQESLHCTSPGASPASSPLAAAAVGTTSASPNSLVAVALSSSYAATGVGGAGVRAGSSDGRSSDAPVASALESSSSTPPQPPVGASGVDAVLALALPSSGQRSMGVTQHRVFALRDTGPSLEVSLPPPPNLWAHSSSPWSSTEGEQHSHDDTNEAAAAAAAASFGGAVSVNSSPADVATIPPYSAVSGVTTEITTAPRVLFANSCANASPRAVPSTTAHAPGPGVATGAALAICRERPGDSASDSGSASGDGHRAFGRRRRRLLGLLLQAAPSVACVMLLLRDEGVRQGLEHVRRGLVAAGSYRSSDARRLVAKAAAAAQSAPLDVGRYLKKAQLPGSSGGSSSSLEAFESHTARECKAKWCSIIRPPSIQTATVYY